MPRSCAATVNLAYDGLDAGGAAFQTGSQVRKLNSYSLVSLFARGKSLFFDFVSGRRRGEPRRGRATPPTDAAAGLFAGEGLRIEPTSWEAPGRALSPGVDPGKIRSN